MLGRVLFYYAVEEKWKTNYYLLTLHMAFGEFYYFLGDSPGCLVKYWFIIKHHYDPMVSSFFFSWWTILYSLLITCNLENWDMHLHYALHFYMYFHKFSIFSAFTFNSFFSMYVILYSSYISTMYIHMLQCHISSIWGKDIFDLENCCQWWWAIKVLFYI